MRQHLAPILLALLLVAGAGCAADAKTRLHEATTTYAATMDTLNTLYEQGVVDFTDSEKEAIAATDRVAVEALKAARAKVSEGGEPLTDFDFWLGRAESAIAELRQHAEQAKAEAP